MSTRKPTPEQLQVLRDEVLPVADHFNRTGSLRGATVPSHDILQALHLDLLGYKYDPGCPTCIGDAVRILGNIYREHAEGNPVHTKLAEDGQQDPDLHQIGDTSVAEGVAAAVKSFANTLRGIGGRFVKKSEVPPATQDNRVKMIDGAIAVEVPEDKVEEVRQVIADYHQAIQDATTGEQIQDAIINTQHRLTMLVPDKADHWKMALGQQWDNMVAQVKKTHPDPPPSPGDIQRGEEDLTA